jgi:hypothetical protein
MWPLNPGRWSGLWQVAPWGSGVQEVAQSCFSRCATLRFSDSSGLIGGQAHAVHAQAAAPRALPRPLVGPPTLPRIVYRRLHVSK